MKYKSGQFKKKNYALVKFLCFADTNIKAGMESLSKDDKIQLVVVDGRYKNAKP